jgi:chromosome segregation ATPase
MANLPDRGQMEEIKKALKDKADSFSKGQAIDPKAMKEFLNRSVSLERDIGTLKVRFDKMLNVMDMFTERLNAAQKDILALKQARPAAKGPVQAMPQELAGKIADAEKGLKDIQGLKERVGDIEEALERTVSPERKPGEMNELRGRIEEIEDILEKVTERLKSASPGKIPQPPVDAREMRTIMERIMKLEAAMKAGTASQAPIPPELKDARQLTDRLERIETTIKDMRERLAAVDDDIAKFAEKQPQPPQEPDQNALRPANERLDSLDSRIAGISDKLMQVSGDCQKLSDYLMEGMKHMEEKIRGMENLVKAEDKMISSLGSKQVEVFRPTTYRSHLRQPHPDYYSPPSQAQRQPRPSPIQPAPFQALPPGILPPPPAPPRGNVFTKLRDGTVIRRPYARPEPDSDDVEIIMEHILESMRRRESRDKITRDLMNAGYDLEIIDKAFMQARVG